MAKDDWRQCNNLQLTNSLSHYYHPASFHCTPRLEPSNTINKLVLSPDRMPSNLTPAPLTTMEFITIVHPSQKNSPRLRRQAHSHAARTAHARTRRARAAKHIQEHPIDANSSDVRPLDPAHRIVQAIGLSATVPVSIPNDFQHEPLASFRRSLTPREHMLFDLCR